MTQTFSNCDFRQSFLTSLSFRITMRHCHNTASHKADSSVGRFSYSRCINCVYLQISADDVLSLLSPVTHFNIYLRHKRLLLQTFILFRFTSIIITSILRITLRGEGGKGEKARDETRKRKKGRKQRHMRHWKTRRKQIIKFS